jgi:hypothetical protein
MFEALAQLVEKNDALNKTGQPWATRATLVEKPQNTAASEKLGLVAPKILIGQPGQPERPLGASEKFAESCDSTGEVAQVAPVAQGNASRGELRWDVNDWTEFYNERAAVAEFNNETSRADAEALAWDCCIAEWLNQNPVPTNSGQCGWCGELEMIDDGIVVPFGTESHGYSWLHPRCWLPWHQSRRRKAIEALTAYGITPPEPLR